MPWYGSHSYLNEFIRENRCRKILEIGVYNGENAIAGLHDVQFYIVPVDEGGTKIYKIAVAKDIRRD